MENLYFYPTLDSEMISASGYIGQPYYFAYPFENSYKKLNVKGKNTIHLEDELDSWRVENDGMYLKRKISFEYPEVLYGKTGIACSEAIIGISIIWINHTIKHMGVINPKNEDTSGPVHKYEFEYEFKPGEILGDLELDTILYIKKSAENIGDGEEILINETGVNIGVLDETFINLGNINMNFPIKEVHDKDQPLWWLEMGPWIDPTSDLFDEDNICIYLNTAYKSCPRLGNEVKNNDVLVEIIASAYSMIFDRIKELGYLPQTIDDVELQPGSISKVLFYFLGICDTDTSDFDHPEKRLKVLWKNVEKMISEGDDK